MCETQCKINSRKLYVFCVNNDYICPVNNDEHVIYHYLFNIPWNQNDPEYLVYFEPIDETLQKALNLCGHLIL